MTDSDVTIGEVYRLVQVLRSEMHAYMDTRPCERHNVRLAIIETERAQEAARALRAGTWAGVVAAAGLTAVWELIRRGLRL